jgi:hypothetical protein
MARTGPTLIIRIPLPPKQRGGRKFVVGSGGIAWTGRRSVVDNAIVNALGRAHRWKAMLESGEFTSVTELAKTEKINLSYLCRVLRLTLLAPDIVEAILNGKHVAGLQLSDLLRPVSPVWSQQQLALMTGITADSSDTTISNAPSPRQRSPSDGD